MKNKLIEIDIRISKNGFKVMTPYSTTYCQSISQVSEDIENFLSDYISCLEVKNYEE